MLTRERIDPGCVAFAAFGEEAPGGCRCAEAGGETGLFSIAHEFAGPLPVEEEEGGWVLPELRHGRGFLS